MELRHLTWDYSQPPEDDLWRATRIAEYFPFVLETLPDDDRQLVLEYLDDIRVPEERKDFIRMVCGGKQGPE
ncbi:MAG: hypothetical protein AB1512_05355 [Thermodesulfobacteriota bacterium]